MFSKIQAVEDLDINGQWQIAAASLEEVRAEKMPHTQREWTPCTLPAQHWPSIDGKASPLRSTPGVWLKRKLHLNKQQATASVHFSWEVIAFTFKCYVNGAYVGGQDYYAPGSISIPKNSFREGENEIAICLSNWPALEKKGLRQIPNIPVGPSLFSWGDKSGGIEGQLLLDFNKGQRLRNVLIQPLTAKKTARAVILIEGAEKGAPVNLRIADAAGEIVADINKQVSESDIANGHVIIDAVLEHMKLWTIEDTHLYSFTCSLADSDSKQGHFGMRSFEIRNADFYLNGEPFTVLGSNVLGEWRWSDERAKKLTGLNRKQFLKHYFVDCARAMNANTMRTHTLPPSKELCNLLDKEAILLMAEMPLTYNFLQLKFSSADHEHYHKTSERVILQWMEYLYNHPSIIMWVPTNEALLEKGFDQDLWEAKELTPQMKALDPTRVILRSGRENAEVADHHCYTGFWGGSVGGFQEDCDEMHARFADKKPIFNTEYLGGLMKDMPWQYTGQEEFDSHKADYFVATTAMRQTETMRRLKYDGILPYMFRSWFFRERIGGGHEETRVFSALRSALAPVAVSVDLPDWNMTCGDSPQVDVYLMNDLNKAVTVDLECMVLNSDPDFLTDGAPYKDVQACFAQSLSIPARSQVIKRVAFPLPAQEGRAWLVARMKRAGTKTVMSQRDVRVYKNDIPQSTLNNTYRIVGINDAAFLKDLGIDVVAGKPAYRETPRDMLIVWENPEHSRQQGYIAASIQDYIKAGKRVLMMRQSRGWRQEFWNSAAIIPTGPDIDFSIAPLQSSSAFKSPTFNQQKDPITFRGLKHEDFLFVNGFTNDVCKEYLLQKPSLAQPPAYASSDGQMPSDPSYIVIESEYVVESNFVADHDDNFFMRKQNGQLEQISYAYQRGQSATLLSTKQKPADGDYKISLSFETKTDIAGGDLWVFEQGRKWASPFSWSIDGAAAQSVGIDKPMQLWTRVSLGAGPVFAWSPVGKVGPLKAGKHNITITCAEAKSDGHYLLSQDCFMIVPSAEESEILMESGVDKKPILTRMRSGKSEIIISNIIMDGRVNRSDTHYDPAIERLLFNLMSFE